MIKTLKLICLAAAIAFSASAAHAAVGDDSTCKFGCWASNAPAASANTTVAGGLDALGLLPAASRLA